MILEVSHVHVAFGGLAALTDVSFSLPEGQLCALIGPNGAGKTTLFDVLSGVRQPTAGAVTFRGAPLAGMPAHRVARLGLGRTYQIVRPLADLSVLENAMVGACFGRLGASRSAARGAAESALARTGLAHRQEQLAGTLNLAEKKRLELARALAASPHLLLLDEVLAGLTPVEVESMLGLLRGLRGQGVAVLMIEHVMQAVMGVSERVLVLESGRLIADGTPGAVVEDPRVIEAYLGSPALAAELEGRARRSRVTASGAGPRPDEGPS